ncbi:PREDICTED: C-C motif chemokine 3-like 1 [Nipponia nippon]|uniref:C-C motif chemokine 3-like 1 n=1 Tax=Nipponia nippon TaxID=128390 RepID=UPI0005116136|nr:PREDICTED: C-C motif chemokine 3-like 1 [Nipponia nippon]
MKVPATALAALLLVAICSPAKAHRSDSGIAASSQKPGDGESPGSPRQSLYCTVGSHWGCLSAPTGTRAITCCFAYMHRPIRRSNIITAYQTSSKCIQPAVILVTNRGNEICADPEAHWVQKYLKHFQILEH